MGWFGGNPNFDERTGEMIPEDSPEWRDPSTGEYTNKGVDLGQRLPNPITGSDIGEGQLAIPDIPNNEVGYRFGGGLLDIPAMATPAPQFYDSQGNKQLGNFADNINQHIVGLNVLEGDRLAAADINGDGKVNISDTTEYLRRDTGIADWNEGQGADYYNQFYQQGDRYVDNPNAGQKRGDKYMKYEAPAGDMPVDGGNATNPLDQGRYVGNPNHGGGNGNTPFGSPPTNKQPSTLPDWMENVPRDPNLAYTTELRFDTFTDPVTGESWSGDKRDYRLRDTGLLQNPNPIMPEWTQSTAPAPTQQPTQELPPGYIPGVTALPQQEPSTPIWGAPTGYNGPTSLPTYDALLNYDYSGYNPYGTTSGMPNLGYASSQLAGTQPAGLEKQNLDYAMAQLGMMTGGYGRGYTQPGDFGTPTNPQAGVTYGGGDGETGNFGSSSDNYRSPQDYQDYLTGDRSFLQGALGLFGPLGTGLGIATDYDMGFSTLSPNTGENLGYTNPFTDEYSAFYNENYAGPGSDMAFTQDLMYPTEQRDMLINQQSFDILPEQTEESFTDWLGGMFGGNTLNYDPDMDLERSDWSDTTPAAPGSFDNRLQGPWSGTDTYKNSLEGYANAEQINKDFNEMLNWEDTDPQSVQEFTKMFSSLNNLTEAEFNKLALEGLKKDEEKKIADVLAKEQTRQEAITDIKSSLSNLGSVMTEQKEWTATQFEDYQGAMDFQIDNIKETLSSQLSLNEAQRSILRDAMMEMTSNSVQSINAQLMSISDTNSKQYNDLLSKLETVEGDLTQQIEDAYTGPNTGYNPITDTAPDTGGTSPEDLGGTSTTDEDAFAEIDSGYDDPSESSGPSDSGSSDSGQHDSSGGSISNDSFDNDDDAGGWSW